MGYIKNFFYRIGELSKTQPLVGMGFYSLIGFLRPAIYIFLLPIYLAYFTESEYAIYNLMIDFAAITMVLASLKINTSMLTHYYDHMGDHLEQEKILSNLYTASLILGLVFIGLGLLGGDPFFKLVFKDDAVRFFPYGLIVIGYTVLFEANQTFLTYLKNEKEIWVFTTVMLTHVLSIVVLQFVFIILLSRGVTGALEGILYGNILVTILVLIIKPNLITFKINRRILSNAFRFSVPLLPYLLIYWFLMRGGRFFLESYTDLDTVAVYALLMVLAAVIILAVEAVINGVRPFLFEEFARGNSGDGKMISLLCKMIVNIPLLFVPLIILISCFIHLLTEKEAYFAIADYMPWACLLFFLMVLYKMFYQQLIFVKKSRQVTILSMVSMLFLIVGYIVLIPRFGIYGVLAATITANLIMVILFYHNAQKYFYVAYELKSILLTPILVFGSILIIYLAYQVFGWPRAVFGSVQFVVSLLIIFLMNMSNMKEYLDIFKNKKVL